MELQKKGTKIYFFDAAQHHVEKLKTHMGAQYDARTRCYSIAAEPIHVPTLLHFESLGIFKLSDEILEWVNAAQLKKEPPKKKLPLEYSDPNSEHYKVPPRPYQMEALKKLHNLDCALLGMDMGTGKTKTTIDLLSINRKKYDQILVICPMAVRGAWVSQVHKYSPPKNTVRVLSLNTKKEYSDHMKWVEDNDNGLRWLIVNTEALSSSLKTQQMVAQYIKKAKTALVVDESHHFLSHDSARTRYLIKMAPECVLRYFLTGTAIVKHLGDLFPTLTMMDPSILGTSNFYTFRAKYLVVNDVQIGANRTIKTIIGVKNQDEFLSKIDRYTFICKKDDVLDLPSKRYKLLTLPLEKEHEQHLSNVKKMVLQETNSTILHKIQLIKAAQRILAGYVNTDNGSGSLVKTPIFKAKNDPKLKTALQLVKDHYGQIIIWSASRYQIETMTELLREAKINCVAFYGDTPKERRQEIIDDYKAGKYKVIIANPSVGGSGIELTSADLVIYLSNTHKYGDRAQSEDRCHRIGQTKSVLYIDIAYIGTYDELILKALEEKKNLSELLNALKIEDYIGI